MSPSSFQFPVPTGQKSLSETEGALWGLFESAVGFGTASFMNPNRMSVKSYSHGLTPENPELEVVDLRFKVDFYLTDEGGVHMKVQLTISNDGGTLDQIEVVIKTGFESFEEVVELHKAKKSNVLLWIERNNNFEENVSSHSSKFWDFDPRVGYNIITPSPMFDNPFWGRDSTGESIWYGGLYGWRKK